MHIFHKIISCAIGFTTICFLHSCTENITAEIQSYVEINDFDYAENNSKMHPHPNSYKSTKITDAWVTMDGQIIGNFEIPCKIPILSQGTHSFDISPGIKVNGIAGTRIKYPFYKKYQTEIILNMDESVNISPKTTYKTDPNDPTKPSFRLEQTGTFEQAGTIFEPSSISDTTAIIQS